MSRDDDRDHVVSQGTLLNGDTRLDYYTTNPAPHQWVAVGVISTPRGRPNPRPGKRLCVGNGDSELAAMIELQSLFLELAVDLNRAPPLTQDVSGLIDPQPEWQESQSLTHDPSGVLGPLGGYSAQEMTHSQKRSGYRVTVTCSSGQ